MAVKMVRSNGVLVTVPIIVDKNTERKDATQAVGPKIIRSTANGKAGKATGLKKKKVKPVEAKKGTSAKAAAAAKEIVAPAHRVSLRSKERNRTAAPRKKGANDKKAASSAIEPSTHTKKVVRAVTPSTFPSVLRRHQAPTQAPLARRSLTPSVGRFSKAGSKIAPSPAPSRIAQAAGGPLQAKKPSLLEPLRAAPESALRPVQFEFPQTAPPPPRIRETPDLLTPSKIAASCDRRDSLPNGDVLKERGFSDLIGFDLTGKVSYASLESFVKEFPRMRIISLYNCPQLEELFCLRELGNGEILYLGELPQIGSLMLKKLFSKGKREVWSELKEVHLAGMEVTDECLESLSLLPKLKTINVSCCSLLTAQGLKLLQKGAPALRELSIEFCPLIEPFAIENFKLTRREVRVISGPNDPSIMEMAVIEANERMAAQAVRNESLFFAQAHLPDQRDRARIFYERMFGVTGCPTPQEMSAQQMDQILQAYKAHYDAAGAFCKELERQGHFSKEKGINIPHSVSEVLVLAAQAQGRELKVRMLDFSDSGLPFLPSWVSNLEWEHLETIDFRGTHVKGISFIPDEFLKRCPKLTLIRFDGCDQRIAIRS